MQSLYEVRLISNSARALREYFYKSDELQAFAVQCPLARYLKLFVMAGNPVDPLQALTAALAVQADSKEQADLLAALRESLEAHPSPIPILCTTLIKTVSGAGDSLLKRWVLDLLHFAICRSTLTLEARTTR